MLIVGTVAFDAVSTPLTKKPRKSIGGSATYSALAGALFTKLSVVAVVGKDFLLDHRQIFSRGKIDTTGIKALHGSTMKWGGKYYKNLNERKTTFLELNVVEQFNPKLSGKHKKQKIVFLGNINPHLQSAVYSQLKDTRLVALDTMNHWTENYRAKVLQILAKVDVLFVNDSEAKSLSGEKSLAKAGAKILKLMGKGQKTVIIKQGSKGSNIYQKNKKMHLPAYPVKRVQDPTGAGDAFAGGFLGYLAGVPVITWDSLCRAGIFGTVAASFCVEHFGTKGLENLSLKAVQNRVKKFALWNKL